MKAKLTAEETVGRFRIALAGHALELSWTVGRELDGRSNRNFVLETQGQQLHLFVKVSQRIAAFGACIRTKLRRLSLEVAGP